MQTDQRDPDQSLLNRALTLYRTEGPGSLLKGAHDFAKYDVWKPVRTRITGFADRHGLVGPDEVYPVDYYLKRKRNPWRTEANHVGEVLNDQFAPRSVIDFGCAVGAHLEPFHEAGIEVRGVEGSKKAIEHAVIPQRKIVHHDLREKYDASRTYDLALSIEVAEHIPEKFSDTYVSTICEAGDVVVITAAPPGQGGTHHVNEQPPTYWIDKFEERGHTYDDELTESLSNSFEVDNSDWVKNNLLVFKNG